MSKRSKKTPKTRKPGKATTSDVEPDAVLEAPVDAAQDPTLEEAATEAPEDSAPAESVDEPAANSELILDVPYCEVIVDETQPEVEGQAEAQVEPTTETESTPAPDNAAPETTEAPATIEAPATPEAPEAPKDAPPAKPKKDKKESGPKKLSALDAAAQVLQAAGKPMTCPEMIEQMSREGLWSSPNGATPAATLYSAILRELKKGDRARFVKAQRGKFESTP
jgi:hypothetical protein